MEKVRTVAENCEKCVIVYKGRIGRCAPGMFITDFNRFFDVCYPENRELAVVAARVLTSFSILVYLNEKACPTPELSFAVKMYNFMLGIVITASHNPKEYNGYKVYDSNGCQVPFGIANIIYSYIEKAPNYEKCLCEHIYNERLIYPFNCEFEFVDCILRNVPGNLYENGNEIKIVYTPLHGTDNIPIQRILKTAGFQLIVVNEQADDNGDFPTVFSSNPEDTGALKLAISKGSKTKADVVLGTDSDCDRIGVAVRSKGEYILLSGNQIGALLLDFLLQQDIVNGMSKPAVVNTIVSADLGLQIALSHGITVFSTFTGLNILERKSISLNVLRLRMIQLSLMTSFLAMKSHMVSYLAPMLEIRMLYQKVC